MKNKRILIFTMSPKQSQWEAGRVEEEAIKMGVEVKRPLYRDISFHLDGKNGVVKVDGEKVDETNTCGVLFRVAGTKSGKYTEGRNLLIRILRSGGVFCANSKSYLGWTRMGKIAQHGVFVENEIPVVPTEVFYQKCQILEDEYYANGKKFGEWEYPIIAKHDKGYQGKSVRKFDNFAQVKKWVNKIDEKNLGMFLWQKCLPTRWDLRVIVIGGEAVGAMKRTAVGSEFRSNFSLGGEVEAWNLSEDEKNLAEKVARVCGLDYCGVDIMKDTEGNNYILEVNRQCQFQGFEKATGINIAKRVVELLTCDD